MKFYNKLILGSLIGASLLTTSCSDFLDRHPESSITPDLYFSSANDLAAYVVNYYPSFLVNVDGSQLYHTSGYNAGIVGYSDHISDNNASGTGSTTFFGDGSHWTVGSGRALYNTYSKIRICNWFFDQVNSKYESGVLSGSAVDHYIGEMYFFRAMTYFNAMVQYGDLPILTEAMPDNNEVLMANSIRAPRNEVARFILSDLDKAISMMQDKSAHKGQRVNKQAALLFKSRVALFEGTFEKYHRGSGRVPGDNTWPGAAMSYNSGKTFDIDGEIRFFLQQAMDAASQIADATTLTPNSGKMNPESGQSYGWNSYFEMFSTPSLSTNDEVLLWREYSKSLNITHNAVMRLRVGNNLGFTRSLVRSFLMKNGLPWYAAGSGYKGDSNLMNETADRDERLQLFMWKDEDALAGTEEHVEFGLTQLVSADSEKRMITGYGPRKFYCYDYQQQYSDALLSTNACPIFRSAEALLNYMEACYELNGSLDSKAQDYWTKLRTRAGVSTDFNATIAATDLSRETEDWGLYSGATTVDATLFNIRRERRNEFIGEDKRYADMLRWRSFDHLIASPAQVYGFNYWEEQFAKYEEATPGIIADGTSNAIISSKDLGNYIMPYRRTDINNELSGGLTWHEAYYLYPLGIQDMNTASPDFTVANTTLYQNVNWPTVGGAAAMK